MRTLLSLFSLSSCLLLANAHGADITRIDAHTLLLKGAIERGDDAKLEKMYTPGTTLLKVRSVGGDSEAGILMGSFIHDKNLDLEVVGGCASSCANYLFPAARHKTIPAGAVLGFHGTLTLTALAGKEEMRRQFTASGMPPDEVEKQLPVMVEYVNRIARMESEFVARIGVNPQFYRDFKTIAENADAVEKQYASKQVEPLWWPSSERLAACYGVRGVTDLGRPAALDSVGHALDETHGQLHLLLLGDQPLPRCGK
ncbi:hypothetical protein SRABI118_03994 [Massilia sp. Bi118]|uniref:hypothetical protein n=1 Tax=Massilia sp. Bi118 TaxID=2822346 RepID=UPI001DBF7926|nr:hypothetical protein [Massilia sp. Bi118]CAH0288345.1 hypothetical protein SRABI118_03994 [Massilia sp. Bi118]